MIYLAKMFHFKFNILFAIKIDDYKSYLNKNKLVLFIKFDQQVDFSVIQLLLLKPANMKLLIKF